MGSSGTKLIRLLVLASACALLGAGGATAGAPPNAPASGLEDLWRAYPLDPSVPPAPVQGGAPSPPPAEPEPVAPEPVAPAPAGQTPAPEAGDGGSSWILYTILGVLGFVLLFSGLAVARVRISGQSKATGPPRPPGERLNGVLAELSDLDARVGALVAVGEELDTFPSSWPRLPPFKPPQPPKTPVVEVLRLASEREFDKVTPTLSIRRSSSVSGNADSEHKAPKVDDVATLVAAPLDPRKFEEVGSQVGSVLRAAGEAAEQIRADALQQAATLREQAQADAVRIRNDADAQAKETRQAGETYAANHRRDAEETVRKLIEESEAQARAVREAAEDMARKIEEGARQHQLKVREEARSLEERMQNSLEGLRDLASDLQELIQGKQKREAGPEKREPGIDSLLESVRSDSS